MYITLHVSPLHAFTSKEIPTKRAQFSLTFKASLTVSANICTRAGVCMRVYNRKYALTCVLLLSS